MLTGPMRRWLVLALLLTGIAADLRASEKIAVVEAAIRETTECEFVDLIGVSIIGTPPFARRQEVSAIRREATDSGGNAVIMLAYGPPTAEILRCRPASKTKRRSRNTEPLATGDFRRGMHIDEVAELLGKGHDRVVGHLDGCEGAAVLSWGRWNGPQDQSSPAEELWVYVIRRKVANWGPPGEWIAELERLSACKFYDRTRQ